MSYATYTSLETLMIGVDFDVKTTALARKCIEHAEEKFIKPSMAYRYDVSGWVSGSVPPSVVSMSEEIAMGLMYRYMSRGSKESLARANDIIKPVLEQIAKIVDHKAHLLDTSGSTVADISTGAYYCKSTTEDYKQVFDVDDPINWSVDSDQLDDIADER